MAAGELEQVVSGASEGSGGQLARTSSHYMGPVASDSLAHTWMHHAWADAGHVLNRYTSTFTVIITITRRLSGCLFASSQWEDGQQA